MSSRREEGGTSKDDLLDRSPFSKKDDNGVGDGDQKLSIVVYGRPLTF